MSIFDKYSDESMDIYDISTSHFPINASIVKNGIVDVFDGDGYVYTIGEHISDNIYYITIEEISNVDKTTKRISHNTHRQLTIWKISNKPTMGCYINR